MVHDQHLQLGESSHQIRLGAESGHELATSVEVIRLYTDIVAFFSSQKMAMIIYRSASLGKITTGPRVTCEGDSWHCVSRISARNGKKALPSHIPGSDDGRNLSWSQEDLS